IESDWAKAHFGLADVLLKQGQINGALNHYAAALQSNPNIAEADYKLGSALLSGKQDPQVAVLYLRNAVGIAPDWPEALNALAWTLATHSDPKVRNGADATRF